MSVSTTTNEVELTGGGSDASPYSFPYPLQADADLELLVRVDATGVEYAALTLTTDYTVARASDNSTATVTLVSTTESDRAWATGNTLVIKRVQPLKQTSSYTRYGGVPENVIEADLDDIVLQLQYLQSQMNRKIGVQDTEPLANLANLQLGTLIGNASAPIIVNATEDGFGIGTTVSGQVIGPASATDNALARFNATTGELIQNSGIIVDDSNNVTGMGTLASGTQTVTGDIILTAATPSIGTDTAGDTLALTADAGVTNLTLSGASGSELATFEGLVTSNGGVHITTSDTAGLLIESTIAGSNIVIDPSSGYSGVAVNGNADNIVVTHNTTQVGMSIISSITGACNIYMGDTASSTQGRIIYDNTNDELELWASNASQVVIDSSNATLSGGIVVAKQARYSAYGTLSATTGAANWDMDTNPTVQVTPTGVLTITPTNVQNNSSGTITITQGGTGYAVNWDASVKWAGGVAPTLSTASKVYVVSLFCYDGTNLVGAVISEIA